jgi:hypothetical protein
LIKSQNESKQQIADLKAQLNKGNKPAKPAFQIDWGDKDAIATALLENTDVALVELFQQFNDERDRLQAEKTQKLTQEQQANSEKEYITKYFTETEGALKLWEDGSITKYMNENPHETVVSAHKALTREAEAKKFEEEKNKAIEDAVKQAKLDVIKELKSKGRAASLSSSGGPPKQNAGIDDELKNPQNHGGRKNVLVRRLKRMMDQAS